MTDFEFWAPTYYSFGRGKEAGTGALVKRFGGHMALLHYGGGSAVKSGLVGRVKESLAEAGVGVVPEFDLFPSLAVVGRLDHVAVTHDVEQQDGDVVAVGG